MLFRTTLRTGLLVVLLTSLIACDRKPRGSEAAQPGEWVGIILKAANGQPELHVKARSRRGVDLGDSVNSLATAVAAARGKCLTQPQNETVQLRVELVGGALHVPDTGGSATTKCVAGALEGARYTGPDPGNAGPFPVDLELSTAP